MASFVGRAPVRVAVDERPGEWIEIKAKLGADDRNRLTDALMSVGMAPDAGSGADRPDVAIHLGQYTGALLRVGVVNWKLLDEEGKEVPFDRALIGELDPDDALVDKVLGELATRNPISRKPGPSSTKAG